MPTLSPTLLQDFINRIFQAAGAPEDIAARVAESLVLSNLSGHDSHGAIRVIQYLLQIDDDDLVPDARPEVIQETDTTLKVDGHYGFGQVVAQFGMARLIEKAQAHHLAACVLSRSHHIGRLGEYAEQAASAGLFGLIVANANIGGRLGPVAPFGGAERLFSTDPIAFAFPAGERPTILVDFATSVVAEGKLRVARQRGETVPEGWVIDRQGRPSTEPNDFYDGGAILSFGDHKGYSLAFLGEILAGALSGTGTSGRPGPYVGNGVWMMAMNIAAFQPLVEFAEAVDLLGDRIKQVTPLPGVTEVLLPGEPEVRARQKRGQEGIYIEGATWETIVSAAAKLGVSE